MSERSLVKLVASVWSTAILVAVFIGLPALLTADGVEINTGLIVNALSAIGAFSAAGVALWIATSDRRQRERERDAGDEARAQLVIISANRHEGRVPQSAQLQMIVRNLSPRAIVDATFVGLVVEGHEHLHLRPTTEDLLPVVAAGTDGNFMFQPAVAGADPFYRALIGQYEQAPGGGHNQAAPATIGETTKMTATVRWTDASGKTWQRSGSRPPMRQEKPVRISR